MKWIQRFGGSGEGRTYLNDCIHQKQAVKDGEPDDLDRVSKYSRINGE